MAIRILHTRGQYLPILVCDVCQKRIEKAADGIECTAPSKADVQDSGITNVFHMHKGAWDHQLRARVGKGGWDELTMHFHDLLYNLGITQQDLERARRIRENF